MMRLLVIIVLSLWLSPVAFAKTLPQSQVKYFQSSPPEPDPVTGSITYFTMSALIMGEISIREDNCLLIGTSVPLLDSRTVISEDKKGIYLSLGEKKFRVGDRVSGSGGWPPSWNSSNNNFELTKKRPECKPNMTFHLEGAGVESTQFNDPVHAYALPRK